MENASKALIMAGGILIAILVLGALLLMFNQLSDYQKSGSELTNISQLSEFNKQFTQYVRNDLKGVELISLVNKVVDFNQRTGIYGEIDYTKKIKININITDAFQKKYGSGIALNKFKVGNYTVQNQTNSFYKMCQDFRKYEEIYTLDVMTKLVSNRSSIEDGTKTTADFTIDKQSLKDLNGNNLSKNEVMKILNEYSEYSLLKTSTFQSTQQPGYDGNQITSMSFQFVK